MPESQGLINMVDNAYDTRSKTIGTIDIVHKRVHQGKHFVYTANKSATLSTHFINVFFIGQGSTKNKRHMIMDVSADKAGMFTFLEGSLSSGAGGTTATAINSDRMSTIVSQHKIKVQPTTKSSGAGTTLYATYIGANSPPVRVGGNDGSRNEFILASSKSYLARFNPGTNATNVIIVAQWYEEG